MSYTNTRNVMARQICDSEEIEKLKFQKCFHSTERKFNSIQRLIMTAAVTLVPHQTSVYSSNDRKICSLNFSFYHNQGEFEVEEMCTRKSIVLVVNEALVQMKVCRFQKTAIKLVHYRVVDD